jgi:hypothetical protein
MRALIRKVIHSFCGHRAVRPRLCHDAYMIVGVIYPVCDRRHPCSIGVNEVADGRAQKRKRFGGMALTFQQKCDGEIDFAIFSREIGKKTDREITVK